MTPKVVYKYPLELVNTVQTFEMYGQNPVPVHVAVQDGKITLWMEGYINAEMLQSDFKIVATGQSYNGGAWKHIGTVQMNAFVWHVLQAVKL